MKNKLLPPWFASAFSLELRNLIAYRLDFWLFFLGTSMITFFIAYYLWSAIYNATGADHIGGMKRDQMLCYYFLIPFVFKTISGFSFGMIANEIYSGDLNKFLLYPLSYLHFKLATNYAYFCFALLQLLLAWFFATWFWDYHGPSTWHGANVLAALIALSCANYCFFLLSSSVDLIAFWADNVWSLQVACRMIMTFLGGAVLPLELFPTSIQAVVSYLPFAYFFSFPTEILMGKISFFAYLRGIGTLLVWVMIISWIRKQMWERGSRNYTGVGI